MVLDPAARSGKHATVADMDHRLDHTYACLCLTDHGVPHCCLLTVCLDNCGGSFGCSCCMQS